MDTAAPAEPVSFTEPSAPTPYAEPLLPAPAATPVPAHWTPLSRAAFRIAFLYFFCFMFCFGNGTVFSFIPFVGGWFETVLTWPFNHLAVLTGKYVFHLTGLAAAWHPTGSGDTTLNWILNGLFLAFALAGGLLWTAVAHARGSRRTQYQTLYAWLRFGLRLTCGMFMLNYGMAKLFPIQMAPISIAILNEPVGQSSPMTLLWSLIGMNPLYEIVCGAAEVLGGTLLLFRRTALAGALLSAFVMANVVLYNFFFDVPVKLFALALLLALLFITLPDLQALYRFFWLHQPAAPAGIWVPPAERRAFRIATRTIELIFTILFLAVFPVFAGIGYFKNRAAVRVPTPLLGAWHLDATPALTGAFTTGEGLPASDLYIDSPVRAFTRSTDGALWRTYLTLDPKTSTLSIMDFPHDPVLYAYRLPDPNHLILTAKPPDPPKPDPKHKKPAPPPTPFTPETVALTRTPIPTHYPLLDRGFHLINQWGLER